MRPTLDYFIDRFDYYNQLCFDGKLKRPLISLNTRYSAMGLTKCEERASDDGKHREKHFRIEISVRRDLPEYEYIDTLVHEMIHYYIISNDLEDDSPHGTLFQKIMKDITDRHGIRVTINYDPSEEVMIATRTRNRFICVAETLDGHTYLAVVAKNKLFQFWDLIPTMEGVTDVRWYVSDRQIFEIFPVAVSPQLFNIDAGLLHHYLTGAQELENDGRTIRVKRN